MPPATAKPTALTEEERKKRHEEERKRDVCVPTCEANGRRAACDRCSDRGTCGLLGSTRGRVGRSRQVCRHGRAGVSTWPQAEC
jgi:hypothetical protein